MNGRTGAGIPIVPTRVNSERSLTIETTGVARRAA